MAIDTPARIAVLGAGPIGLEAALYARFLGYEVELFDQASEAAAELRRWAHLPLATPWRMNTTPLGVAALAAQNDAWEPPAAEAMLTAGQLVERYLAPLAASDLVVDALRLGRRVIAVGRDDLLRQDLPGHEDRGDGMFRILHQAADSPEDAPRDEQVAHADVVIDATGRGRALWAGPGGTPALGERALAVEMEYELPDVTGAARESFVGRHLLLVGTSHDAARAATVLAELCEAAAGTRLTWVTPRVLPAGAGPLESPGRIDTEAPITAADAASELTGAASPPSAADPPGQHPYDELLARANRVATQASGPIAHLPGTQVQAIARVADGSYQVRLVGEHAGELLVDRVLALSGRRTESPLHGELQVVQHAATGAYAAITDLLAARRRGDPVALGPWRWEWLVHPEPNYYVVGVKSYGREEGFTLSEGHDQVRAIFALIGDRQDLNLYLTTPKLSR